MQLASPRMSDYAGGSLRAVFGDPATSSASPATGSPDEAGGSSPKSSLERLLSGAIESIAAENVLPDWSRIPLEMMASPFAGPSAAQLRNSSKTLKCPKCNWHYKYQETLEIHMKEKHADGDVRCGYCAENRPHPKLARGESYQCGYKPYRCELCKYSTTTKGNLSIHMQSDKHLHAMQELPNSIASLTHPAATRSPLSDREGVFICLICTAYGTNKLCDMVDHAEKDRSRPAPTDLATVNGVFRCQLCPYNTNLKANFQLHTRTDKHIQRVQLANHIREGCGGSFSLTRLSSAKSVVQVLCRPCQEIFSCSSSLREHCEGVAHRTHCRQPISHWTCRLCPFEAAQKGDALGHMSVHPPASWLPSLDSRQDSDDLAMREEAAFACAACPFTSKDESSLIEHAATHDAPEQCTLCSTRPSDLTQHMIQEHKISESAVERLLASQRAENSPATPSSHPFRCPACPKAFSSEHSLQQHQLSHLFDCQQRCPVCAEKVEGKEELAKHLATAHPEEARCELCAESFTSRQAMLAHLHSAGHLQRAKRQLEAGAVDLSSQALTVDGRKPFRCNVCNIAYGQGTTLDIHLRSVAHQSRMGKVADLVAAGEVDSSKPVIEQPGGPPQRLISDLIGKDDEAPAESAMAMLNFLNMAQMFAMAGQGEDEYASPRNALQLRAMLNSFGMETVTSLCPALLVDQHRIDQLPDEQIPSVCQVACQECGESLPSLLSLKNHSTEKHQKEIPEDTVRQWAERLKTTLDDLPCASRAVRRSASREASEPPEKKAKEEPVDPNLAQLALLNMMGGSMGGSGMPAMPFGLPGFPPGMEQFFNPAAAAAAAAMMQQSLAANSPAKRARTRITDDQLKVLRQYFDINNSPTEQQIKEMSIKAQLPEKVIKHWFRNTLFKERQRDKDSPYNFSIPPSMKIDLDAYEKTGEARVVALSQEDHDQCSSPTTPAARASAGGSSPAPPPQAPPTTAAAAPAVPPPLTLQSMMAQQGHPFAAFLQDPEKAFAMLPGALPSMPPMPTQQQQQQASSGRRANRTRFTDFQLRTLQQFFEKQAYPKDDDLEVLSKKLQLSPRVIVVWFQNARQKARKIYENQPNVEGSDRFVRTPGCNFQCKRCQLVFQRYYELIQHQQKKCYKDDSVALQNDNEGVVSDEPLAEEEKGVSSSSLGKAGLGAAAAQLAALAANPGMVQPAELLKLIGGGTTDALLKMCETAGTSTAPFHKRCPFCAVLFRQRGSLLEHLSTKHSEQLAKTPVDVDRIPDADDVPSLSSALSNMQEAAARAVLAGTAAPLDLSSHESRESLSMSPYLGGSGDEAGEEGDEGLDLSSFLPQTASPMGGASGGGTSGKRYRTHLTPTQVHVMKCVFADYKTPSMAECAQLGREIGLHKRVVQVWFQNARAKERKSRAAGEAEEKPQPERCTLCAVDYPQPHSMQEHLFSETHLAALKSQLKGDDQPQSLPSDDVPKARPPVRDGGRKSSSAAPLNLAGMMQFGLPMMYDPQLMGTPMALLQVPEKVREELQSALQSGADSSRFTQDGLSPSSQLDSDDALHCGSKDVEVGWACRGCGSVFQAESALSAHQSVLCAAAAPFVLIQTHYTCKCCELQFGSQKELKTHCESPVHMLRRAVATPAAAE